MRFRLGVDIGGTFTDATLLDEATGEVRIGKVPTTPHDPAIGFMRAARRLLEEHGVAPADLSYAVHATTVATNAVIEGKTARAGFVTTDGFRDMLEVARQVRPSLYDLQFEKPRPLVPRHRCVGVPERLGPGGEVLVPLDEGAVRAAATRLKAEGVSAIALCFLHAYANPVHERRAAEIIRAVFPEAELSVSSEVAPEFREYTRASTTVVNACIQPVVARYLAEIEARLREAGIGAELLVMQSSGGVFTFAAARERPVFMVESGPAAGVIAAAHLGAALGQDDLISLDMGGTTAKAGLVRGGTPRITKEYEVGVGGATGSARPGLGGQRGGYPIRTPVIDLVEIGAGGGSVAWIDSGGALRVGPGSAGADPGPACYGRGGEEPTVTDADLVLGRLNPRYFLGGEIALDVERAGRAIHERCAQPLGLGDVEVAHAIVEIANAAMVNAIRLVSVQRGHDPRDFTLVAFGGAGPAHANRLAAETGAPRVLVPMSPGTFSALGLLVTDLRHEFATTLVRRFEGLEPGEAERAFAALEAQGRAALDREGVAAADMAFLRQLDLRYVGQSYELTVPAEGTPLEGDALARLVERFHAEHDRAYGYSAPTEPIELVTVRLTALGRIAKPRPRALAPDPDASAARKETRAVYFAEAGGYVDCPIYDRRRLGAGATLHGPAVVEELDATTVLHPGYRAQVDPHGNLLLETA
ncbi:MAG TPA: hydantoinase/oxoprolinase family protein [Chloroflexota bacterium]|nr:hydantoinase/oxoprolinase family protein [Chloroflexota bacterium]